MSVSRRQADSAIVKPRKNRGFPGSQSGSGMHPFSSTRVTRRQRRGFAGDLGSPTVAVARPPEGNVPRLTCDRTGRWKTSEQPTSDGSKVTGKSERDRYRTLAAKALSIDSSVQSRKPAQSGGPG